MKRKIIIYLTIITIILIQLSACTFNTTSTPISDSGFYFNTIINITLYDSDDSNLIQECFKLADKYEKMFSNTIETSDISLINSNAGLKSVTVHSETIELLNKAIYYSSISNGAFDVTIGQLSDLWNISEISQSLNSDNNEGDKSLIPDDALIQNAVSHINYQNIIIDENNVYLSDSSSQIDLGGIAKGYIADKMKEYLISNGVASGIINLGGNVLTIGYKNDKTPFNVGIQMPFDENGEVIATIPSSSNSVVTSGIYERYFRIDDKIYHHLLDTKNGYPIDNSLLSVTIVSDSSADGDALSTTCFALGLEDGLKLIESLDNIDAIFVTTDYKTHCTSNIANSIQIK